MRIETKSLDDFSSRELYEYLKLRSEVFVVEQACIYLDLDGRDDRAWHVLGYADDGSLLACTRIFDGGDYMEDPSIGRVAVKASHRGKGLGKAIMEASVREVEKRFNPDRILLSAQTYLKAFYRNLGFREYGDEYLEDGIPHIAMERKGGGIR